MPLKHTERSWAKRETLSEEGRDKKWTRSESEHLICKRTLPTKKECVLTTEMNVFHRRGSEFWYSLKSLTEDIVFFPFVLASSSHCSKSLVIFLLMPFFETSIQGDKHSCRWKRTMFYASLLTFGKIFERADVKDSFTLKQLRMKFPKIKRKDLYLFLFLKNKHQFSEQF